MEWLNKKYEVQISSLSLEEIGSAIKSSVRMNVHEKDAELRVMAFFMHYRTFLRSRKWDLIENNPKVAISHICKLLRLEDLKNNVENDLELGHKSLRKDWRKLYKHFTEKAVACGECDPLKALGLR